MDIFGAGGEGGGRCLGLGLDFWRRGWGGMFGAGGGGRLMGVWPRQLRLIDWGLAEFYHPGHEYNVRAGALSRPEGMGGRNGHGST